MSRTVGFPATEPIAVEPQSEPPAVRAAEPSEAAPTPARRLEAAPPAAVPEVEPEPEPAVADVLRIEARASDARVAALVLVEDGEGWRSLGRSETAAPLEVPRERLTFPARLRARASGADGEILVGSLLVASEPESGLVVVPLGPAGVLRGTVVDQHGRPAPEGMRVVVLAPGVGTRWIRNPDREPTDDGTWGATTTDAAGRFEVRGLIPELRFAIHAAGHGLATNVNLDRAVAGCDEEPRTVQAFPLYIGVTRIGSSATDALVRERYATWEWGIVTTGWPQGSFPTSVNHHPALLGTAVEKEARQLVARGRRVLTLTGAVDQPALALTLKLRFPFLTAKREVEIPRLDPRGVAEVFVDVEPHGGPFGTLDVVFLVPPGINRLAPASRLGTLELQVDEEKFELPLTTSDLLAGQRLETMPYGTYSWKLRIGGQYLIPGIHRRQAVEPFELASALHEVVVDLGWTTSGEIVLVDEDGVPVHRPLSAILTTSSGPIDPLPAGTTVVTGGTVVSMMHWREPPYVLPFVSPGAYVLDLDAGRGRASLVRDAGPFEFSPSEQTRIELRADTVERPVRGR